MSKRQSVIYQAMEVLKFAESFGQKRHADKRNAKHKKLLQKTYTKSKIYTDKTFKHTKNTVITFVRFCKDNYGIRYIDEIKEEYFTEFIKRGRDNGEKFKIDTAATYATHIRKFQEAFNKMENKKLKFYNTTYKEYTIEQKKIKNKMPKWMHNKIIQKAYEKKNDNGRAFEIARNLGLRVGEITKLRLEDFKIKNGRIEEVHIHRSKGGRNRDIQLNVLSQEQREKVNEIYSFYKIKGIDVKENIFKNKADSYSKAFARTRDWITESLGLGKIYNSCGIHSMRKEFAQELYDKEIEKGKSEMEVKNDLTKILGHNRTEVLESYLK